MNIKVTAAQATLAKSLGFDSLTLVNKTTLAVDETDTALIDCIRSQTEDAGATRAKMLERLAALIEHSMPTPPAIVPASPRVTPAAERANVEFTDVTDEADGAADKRPVRYLPEGGGRRTRFVGFESALDWAATQVANGERSAVTVLRADGTGQRVTAKVAANA